jgi:hypothetical protein
VFASEFTRQADLVEKYVVLRKAEEKSLQIGENTVVN